jgi:hypothetical protein|tara:strand:+ start:10926 stop:11117 length:192 start_codon:yes stop_codon:yes gene_type:complete
MLGFLASPQRKPRVDVIVLESPITSRYFTKGMKGQLDGDQIRIGGVWFDYDVRWKVIADYLVD